MSRLRILVGLALLSGCDVLGPGASRPPATVTVNGLEFSLSIEVAAPSDSFPLLSLAVRNTTGVPIVRELASACMLWPRLYRSGSWERPVWDWAREAGCALIGPLTVNLASGETATPEVWRFRLHPIILLGDSLPNGSYVVGAEIRPNDSAEPAYIMTVPGAVDVER